MTAKRAIFRTGMAPDGPVQNLGEASSIVCPPDCEGAAGRRWS